MAPQMLPPEVPPDATDDEQRELRGKLTPLAMRQFKLMQEQRMLWALPVWDWWTYIDIWERLIGSHYFGLDLFLDGFDFSNTIRRLEMIDAVERGRRNGPAGYITIYRRTSVDRYLIGLEKDAGARLNPNLTL